jgi:hypothetical protein
LGLRLHQIEALSWPAGAEDEDGFGQHEWAAWLLDGAHERPDTEPSRPRRLVEAVSRQLAGATRQNVDPRAALALAIERAAVELGPWEPNRPPPSAAAILCRLDGDFLRVLRLADGALLGPDWWNVREHPARVAEYRRESALDLSDQRAGAAMDPDLATEARRARGLNRADGYWAVADDPAAAWQGDYRVFPVSAGQRLLLISDGLTRLIAFGSYGLRDLLPAANRDGLESLAAQLRRLENSDPEARRWPRQQIHADLSAVLLEVVEARPRRRRVWLGWLRRR